MRALPVLAFTLAAASPAVALVVLAGGPWGGLALIWMAGAAVLLDITLPAVAADAAPDAEFPGAEALLWALGLAALLILPVILTVTAHQPMTLSTLALLMATGLWLGQVGHPAAHELIHRPARAPRLLGQAVYTAILMGHHASAHRFVHHRHVATRDDPNTARRGEGFWRFAPRAWAGSFRAGLQAERARGSHAYLAHLAATLGWLALAFTLGGGRGVLIWLAVGAHAQLQILLSDYVQHYGLTRTTLPDGRLEPVGAMHSWNAGPWATSALTLNATRHSDHHCHPSRSFPALHLPTEAPRLPWPLPVAACIALIPPLWHRKMRPLLMQR